MSDQPPVHTHYHGPPRTMTWMGAFVGYRHAGRPQSGDEDPNPQRQSPVGCAARCWLPARLVAELGDGAARCELVACVVRRHGGRLPIARFLQFDQPAPAGRP